MKAVVGSGISSMSDSLITLKPRIEEPSKPRPSSIASSSKHWRRIGGVLPHARHVGEAEVDHLDAFVLDRLHDVVRGLASQRHGRGSFLRVSGSCLSGAAAGGLGQRAKGATRGDRSGPGGRLGQAGIGGLGGGRSALRGRRRRARRCGCGSPRRRWRRRSCRRRSGPVLAACWIASTARSTMAVLDHHLDLHLGQEVDHVLGAPVELGVALLPAEALDLGHGHALEADLLRAPPSPRPA